MSAIRPFSMTRDVNGYNGFGVDFSVADFQTTLTTGAEQTWTVPSTEDGNYQNLLVVFSFAPGSTVWVGINNTATVPGGSITQCHCEMNPQARRVKTGDVIHFITDDASDEIGWSCYAVY